MPFPAGQEHELFRQTAPVEQSESMQQFPVLHALLHNTLSLEHVQVSVSKLHLPSWQFMSSVQPAHLFVV